MLLIFSSALSIDKSLKHSAYCALLGLCAITLGLTLFWIAYPLNPQSPAIQKTAQQQTRGKMKFTYEAIGSGGLALHPQYALGWVSRLADELLLIAYNCRPDTDPREAKILMSLKNGKQQLTLSNGHLLYLKESEQGKGLQTSDNATGLWVKPLLLDNGTVLVEAGRKLTSKEGNSVEEKGQFIVAQQGGIPPHYNPSRQNFAEQIKFARGFAEDLLIQKYGGREYSAWKGKTTLLLTAGTKTYACFVSVGELLQFDEGEWHVTALEDVNGDRPLARIKSASAKAIEIDVWDETGFYPLQVKIEAEHPPRLQLKPEAMPSAIRLRSSAQLSCAFGKRRVILKQGDWLLKTEGGWRNLRRAEEIEQYLNHRLRGELLIFDGIEKEQGRSVMKGHLFDETRTQVQPLSLPIDAEKPQGKSSRKRKAFLPGGQRRAA